MKQGNSNWEVRNVLLHNKIDPFIGNTQGIVQTSMWITGISPFSTILFIYSEFGVELDSYTRNKSK